jgi:uncharacterized protein (DUF362 family)
LPPKSVSPTLGSIDQPQPTSTEEQQTATEQPDPTATAESHYPELSVARGGSPEELTRAVLDSQGGMGRFVAPGDDVIIKPNICVGYYTYEYAATTNPFVIGELVRQALDAGAAKVRVMDFPFGTSAAQAYKTSGIGEEVEQAGGEMEIMGKFKYVETEIPGALDLKSCAIYDDILKTDVLINVPIAKHHGLARLTLGMKNLMGVILNRPMMHANIVYRLADLTSIVKPDLTVVDAVRILHTNGPSGGSLDYVSKLDTMIASTDIVAVDSYAATLFGMQPAELPYVRSGVLKGLGRMDLENLRIDEIAIAG